MISGNLSATFYLISGVLFILALRGLSSPETSRQGNFYGIIGMIIAISVTFLSVGNFSSGFVYVIIFLLAGGAIAKYPNKVDELKMLPSLFARAAIIAPTIITEEIALVTDIKGVCKEGVTLQTT